MYEPSIWNCPIALKCDKRLGNIATDVPVPGPVKFQKDTAHLVASRLHEILRLSDIKTGSRVSTHTQTFWKSSGTARMQPGLSLSERVNGMQK